MLFFLLFAVGAYAANETGATPTFGAYFANWAQYRPAPYTYPASALQNLVPILDRLMYGFVYFCPPAGTQPLPYWAVAPYGSCSDSTEYQLMFVETKDQSFIQEINAMKASNPGMKHIMSVGGWNFPAGFFSKMASSSTNRQKFVSSVQSFIQQYQFDGVDIDWEYPGSAPRTDSVKITCDTFRTVQDPGGSSSDGANLVALFHDLRAALPSASLSFAAQANCKNAKMSNIGQLAPYLDYFHLMSYDYTVSDVPDGAMFSPNSPLYLPPKPAVQMGIDYTVQCYLDAGIKPSQLQLGVAFYGHVWWNPSLSESQWQKFGGNGQIQASCCGPFKQTYGGGFGKGSQQCGSLMYSEIVAAGFDTYYDQTTMSNIGYLSQDSGDGHTKKGAWVTYNDKDSLTAITKYALDKGLAGVFAWDSTMDSIDFSSGQPSYELSNLIVNTLKSGGGGGNICDPSKGCNVCDECCKSYLSDQAECDACVDSQCSSSSNICDPSKGCNVCDSCCKSYITDPTSCNACVKDEC
jgi:chitinase